MADAPLRLWSMRAAYFALALLIVFFHLIPLDTMPRRWAPPDLIVAFTFAWVLRRPDYVPALSIALVMLLADLLFQRPPGLYALLVLLGSEYLKYRVHGEGEASFAAEWAAVAIVVAAIVLGYRLILAMLLLTPPPLAISLIQMLATVAVYPLAVGVSQALMKVRKRGRGDGSALGGHA